MAPRGSRSPQIDFFVRAPLALPADDPERRQAYLEEVTRLREQGIFLFRAVGGVDLSMDLSRAREADDE